MKLLLVLLTIFTLTDFVICESNINNYYLRRELQKKNKNRRRNGRKRDKIRGRERKWLNEYEEFIYGGDELDFGNNDLYCEEGKGSPCYKYKKFNKKQRRRFWKRLQKKLKKENRKINTD